MQDQVEAMSKIPDMKTAYAGNYLTLILPIHDLKKRGEHIFFCFVVRCSIYQTVYLKRQ
jgi:hypothetical protein